MSQIISLYIYIFIRLSGFHCQQIERKKFLLLKGDNSVNF